MKRCIFTQYPDGRKAFVKSKTRGGRQVVIGHRVDGRKYRQQRHAVEGRSILMGGTSTKGLDCSGFTKQVYFMHGIVLSRDASQQVMQGLLVDETGDFSNARPGDLVFFGSPATEENPIERVVHVGCI